MGNLRSVQKIFQRMNIATETTSDLDVISKATKLLLPGVGHFENGMTRLEASGLKPLLHKKVIEEKTPILGICLGMQLMTAFSEEGNINGLGWVDAETKKFPASKLKIPHMGWNTVDVKKKCRLSNNISPDDSFYFVHSYYVTCKNVDDIVFATNYERTFVSGFQHENISGVQFHPEKSYKSGIKLLQNFSNL